MQAKEAVRIVDSKIPKILYNNRIFELKIYKMKPVAYNQLFCLQMYTNVVNFKM